MSRRIRSLLYVLAGLSLLIVLTLLGLFLASRYEPAFYREALEIEPPTLQRGSDRMIRQATALQNATARSGLWQAVITAEEINGWLAVDLAKNHPGTLPPGFSDPRVAIDADGITLGCRFEGSGLNTVLSLAVRPYLSETNVISLRIERARAGLLPLPLENVLERISTSARDMQWNLDWRRSGGVPVAMLSPPEDDDAELVVRIESLELANGEIRIVGSTKRKRQ